MGPEDTREPSINELCSLSVLPNVAYAVRCARRMQPRFRFSEEDGPDAAKMVEYVDLAIRWAESYVKQGIGKVETAEKLSDLASQIAEATYEETEYAGYTAYHAVHGSLLAARAGEMCDQETFMSIVASAYGASRVVLANTPTWVRAQAVQGLRADYVKLLEMTVAEATQRGPLVDTTEAGPLGGLWPIKTPTW